MLWIWAMSLTFILILKAATSFSKLTSLLFESDRNWKTKIRRISKLIKKKNNFFEVLLNLEVESLPSYIWKIVIIIMHIQANITGVMYLLDNACVAPNMSLPPAVTKAVAPT